MSSFSDEKRLEPFWYRHRGPYRLVVTRPARKHGFFKTEWLSGLVDTDDIEDEVRALMTDPRDNINGVSIWSETESMFVFAYNKEQYDTKDIPPVTTGQNKPKAGRPRIRKEKAN